MPRQKNGGDNADRRGIQSIEVGIPVLEAVAAASGPASLKAISDAAGMPTSKVHRYLSSFVRTGLMRQDAASGHYDLAHLALRLGLAALARLDIVKLAENKLLELTARTNATSMLSVWSERGPVVVRWEKSAPPLVTSLALGSILPATTSATGRVFLAHMPPAATRAVIAAERATLKRLGQPFPADLPAMIERVKADGIAGVEGNVIPGLQALAGPVFDASGHIAGTLTLLSADTRLGAPDSEARDALREVCASLSNEAGAPIPSAPTPPAKATRRSKR